MTQVPSGFSGERSSPLWWAAFLTSAFIYIAFRDVMSPQWGWLVKVLPVALLLQWAVSRAHGQLRAFLVAGLTLSGAGDILLSLDGFFIPGLAAFLLAQLTYTTLFLTQFRWQPGRLAWAALIITYTLACSVLVLPKTGDLRLVTTAYLIAISLMALSAGFRDDPRFLRVAMGALVFMISDTLIAIDKFVASFAYADTAIMITYYLAQALITVGMTASGRRLT